MRSAGSKSLADLVALKIVDHMPRVLLIQCKSGKAKLSKKGKAELIELAESIGGTAVYAYKPSPRKIELEDLNVT